MIEIESGNIFGVHAHAGKVHITGYALPALPADSALNLAAHLVRVADPTGARFAVLLAAVCGPPPVEGGADLSRPPSGGA